MHNSWIKIEYLVFKHRATLSAHAFFRNYLHSSEIGFDIPVGQGRILNVNESLTYRFDEKAKSWGF